MISNLCLEFFRTCNLDLMRFRVKASTASRGILAYDGCQLHTKFVIYLSLSLKNRFCDCYLSIKILRFLLSADCQMNEKCKYTDQSGQNDENIIRAKYNLVSF